MWSTELYEQLVLISIYTNRRGFERDGVRVTVVGLGVATVTVAVCPIAGTTGGVAMLYCDSGSVTTPGSWLQNPLKIDVATATSCGTEHFETIDTSDDTAPE